MGNQQSTIVRQIHEEGWNKQDYTNINNIYTDHTILHVGGNSIPVDEKKFEEIVARWKESFADLHFEVLSIIEEDNMVAANLLMKGTHTGGWRGINATGTSISVPHMFFFKFEENKIVEIWEVADFSNTLQQIQSIASNV